MPGWFSAHAHTIGSTNAALANIFKKRGTALDRHWLTAGEQTRGRGRRDRHWDSPRGNFYGSLCLVINGITEANLAVLPLAFGIAIQRAVAELTEATVALKWPNDVLLDGAKCCGLLMERHRTAQSNGTAVIAGIGLNVTSHPSGTPYPASHLAAHGFNGGMDSVFNTLATSVDEVLNGLRAPDFVSQTRRAWLKCAKGVGDVIDVRLANQTLRGIFEELDGEGRLVLRLPDKTTRTITAGDVFFA